MVMGDRIPAGDAAVGAEVQAGAAQQIADMAITRGVERLGGTERIISEWMPIFMDLTELDEAGALGGIRAIAAERLAGLKAGTPCDHPVAMASAEIQALEIASAPGSPRRVQMLATAAAWLAAEIDQLEAGR